MPGVILFVDCDNQPASMVDRLIDLVQYKVGAIACVFLAGNSHGEHVEKWAISVKSRLTRAIVDRVVTKTRKESADAQLILKIGQLRGLFSDFQSVRIVLATADDQILAAAEFVAESGLTIFSVNAHASQLAVTSLAYLDINEPIADDDVLGESIFKPESFSPLVSAPRQAVSNKKPNHTLSLWRPRLFGECKLLWLKKRASIDMAEAGHVLAQKYGVRSREERHKIFSLFQIVRIKSGGCRLY